MARLMCQFRNELGDVDALDVIEHIGPFYLLLICSTVPEVITYGKVTSCLVLLLQWLFEECLSYAVLSLNLLICEASANYAEESSGFNLYMRSLISTDCLLLK